MKKGIEMQEKIIHILFAESGQRRVKWKSLSSFKKWVRLSEIIMMTSPGILMIARDVKYFPWFFLIISLVAIFYSFKFFHHFRKPRKSSLFWKRRTVFERCLAFWTLFLMSLFVFAGSHSSKMRQENLFDVDHEKSGQKHIEVVSRQYNQ